MSATVKQRAALQYIARRPECLMKEIAFDLGASIGSVSALVEKLKLNGLVSRPMGCKRFVITRQGIDELCA